MTKERLTNIDIIKFLSIIIMVIDHMVLVSIKDTVTAGQMIFFSYIPLVQMGFLFSSGYLMAYGFNKEKLNKYLFRVVIFFVLFALMAWMTYDTLLSSASILLNFGFSTLLGLIFLYNKKIKELIFFIIVLFGLDIVFQILVANGITVLDNMLANYSYPINSFSLYFLFGIVLYHYQDEIGQWFKANWLKWLTIVLLLLYPLIFFTNIHVNIYNLYQHLPLLIVVTMFIGLFFFYAWQKVKLPKTVNSVVIEVSNALLYIYVIHYIVFFRWLDGLGLSWWWLTIILLVIIYLSILIRRVVVYLTKFIKV